MITNAHSRGLRLTLGAFAFSAIAVSLLRHAYPVYFDGGGPMPSFFYWGRLPGLAEYNHHQLQYDVRFLVSYCIAALVLTIMCLFVAPKLANRIMHRHSITLHALASLLMLLAVTAISDVINIVWLRNGLFYGREVGSYIRLLIVGLPLAVSSAVLSSFVDRLPAGNTSR